MSGGGNSNGSPRARELGAALRRARQAKELTLKQVATAMRRAESHPSRWETGKLVPSAEDIGALLQILEIAGEERERIIQMAREIDSPDWVSPGIGKQLAALIDTEREATEIITVEPMFIPGLLQTFDYAYAVNVCASRNPQEARHGAIVRIGRQDILRNRRAPKFIGIIGEFALRYPPCSAEVMIEQLHHLLRMAELPNVTIAVVPYRFGFYSPAQVGSFVICETPDGKGMVQLESVWSSTTLSSVRAVDGYRSAATTILEGSLSAEKSIALIEEVMKELESGI